MKKAIIILLVTALAVTMLTGCGGHRHGLRRINDYFYEADTYTELDYGFTKEYFAKNNDNWGGGCSAVSADIGGTRLVGRNMDLNICNKCAYLVRTKVPGKYETFGLSFTFRDVSPDKAEVEKSGISDTYRKILPFMCDDVVNSEGLHVEINMRHGEQDADGSDVFGVEHTNPGAPERIYVFTLGQYLGLNCKDLEEVRRYLAEDIDVYSQKDYWNYCFLITDASGDSALLEFGNGRYYWTGPDADGVTAQTNFYVNAECSEKEVIKTGLGRYETLMNGIGNVTNTADLFELMKKIRYSNFYFTSYEECKKDHFDPRSEVIGETPDYSAEFIMDPENEGFVAEVLDGMHAELQGKSRQELQDIGELWESTFTEVVDPAQKLINVCLFENDSYLYQITFDGIKKISYSALYPER